MPATAPRPGRPRDPELPSRRRDQILRSATRIFARRGFAGTDLQDVADALGVGKGTLYRYFPSKRAILRAAVDRALTGMHETVERAVAGIEDPLDQVQAAIRAYLLFFDEHPEVVELFIQERAEFRHRGKPAYFRHREAHLGRWHALYEGLMGAGRIRALPPGRITDVVGDLVYGTMFANYLSGRDRDSTQQAQAIMDMILHGLLTPAEAARRRPLKEDPAC